MTLVKVGRATLVALSVVLLTACGAPAVPATTSEADGPLVAFYGDSYTLGTGATDPRNRWSTIICLDRGWREYNPSVNGLGFVNNRGRTADVPPIIAAQHPDIVFITMGLNDNFAYERAGEQIRHQIEADFAYLTAELPDARFIVVEPFWYTDERPASVEVIIGWVRDAAEGIGADWVPDASHWIEGHPEWMAGDRLHPNDAGYAEMARRMDAALDQLGL